MFERFYRVDKARSRETGGTGLGLAIVRHVATNHGGDVLVSSQEGEGSTFVLRLPPRWSCRAETTRSSRIRPQEHRHGVSEATVLVVEDEASFVEALTIGLRREGFDVVVATDGAQALEIFDEAQPDLVLLDVMLPKISGIDVCRQLRKKTQIPIIMVTAKGAEIDTVVGLEVGADDYVTKPYRLRELVARMRAVLRRTELAPAGEVERLRSHRESCRSATSRSTQTNTGRRCAVRRSPCRSRSSSCSTSCWRTPVGCCPVRR